MSNQTKTEERIKLARKVLGWVPAKGDCWVGAVRPGTFNCKPSEADKLMFHFPGGNIIPGQKGTWCGKSSWEWRPDYDLKDAFLLVNALVGRGWSFSLTASAEGWQCEFSAPNETLNLYSTNFKADPNGCLAICAAVTDVIDRPSYTVPVETVPPYRLTGT